MATEIAKYRFTVAEYQRMSEAGIFREDDRVELIDGEIVEMAPIGIRHSGCVAALNALLVPAAANRVVVFVQSPIDLNKRTEPQPDLALLKPREDFYRAVRPNAADVLLAIEVADSSLEYDRGVKAALYARAGIPEYWLVNLRDNVIEAYREPQRSAYRVVETLRRGDTIQASALPDLTVAVSAILG